MPYNLSLSQIHLITNLIHHHNAGLLAYNHINRKRKLSLKIKSVVNLHSCRLFLRNGADEIAEFKTYEKPGTEINFQEKKYMQII